MFRARRQSIELAAETRVHYTVSHYQRNDATAPCTIFTYFNVTVAIPFSANLEYRIRILTLSTVYKNIKEK